MWTHQKLISLLRLDCSYTYHGITIHWTKCLRNLSFNMVVTRLELELRYHGKKLRGVTWKLTRSEHGFLPESSWLIAAQVIVPFLVSGLGMVSAGIVMDLIQVWKSKKKHLWNYFWDVDWLIDEYVWVPSEISDTNFGTDTKTTLSDTDTVLT